MKEQIVHVRFGTGQHAHAAFAVSSVAEAREIARRWGLGSWIEQAAQQGVDARGARSYKIITVETVGSRRTRLDPLTREARRAVRAMNQSRTR